MTTCSRSPAAAKSGPGGQAGVQPSILCRWRGKSFAHFRVEKYLNGDEDADPPYGRLWLAGFQQIRDNRFRQKLWRDKPKSKGG